MRHPRTIGSPSGVLANDIDPDGDEITAALVADAEHGSVTLNTNGSFVYTPETDYTGSDAFTYRTSDAVSTSNIATVRITVNPTEEVPNQPFGAVTTGPSDAPELLGTRTDLESGAPPVDRSHVTDAVSTRNR